MSWIVSRPFDLTFFIGLPLLAALVALLLPAHAELPVWGYVAFILLIDVAHVWSSLWRTYLDPIERRQHPLLLTLAPLGSLVGCAAVFSIAPGLFWTAMAYLAVFHFSRQELGFAMLYRKRAGLPMGSLDARVERWLVYALTLGPILWWHAHLPRDFAWFMPGDFLTGLPGWALVPAGGIGAILVLSHLALRLRSGLSTPGRDLRLCTTACVWFGGIVLTNGDFSFTLSNVVAHGVPYVALVAFAAQRRWALRGEGAGRPWIFTLAGAPAFLLPLLALAFTEEGLWDAFVWGEHRQIFGDWGLEALSTHWLVPLLSVPQVTHYVLDGFIWKLDGSNPGLAEELLGAPAP